MLVKDTVNFLIETSKVQESILKITIDYIWDWHARFWTTIRTNDEMNIEVFQPLQWKRKIEWSILADNAQDDKIDQLGLL